MSGRWMAAGDKCAEYREGPKVTGDGTVGNLRTRAVLRELCRVAHDAGVAQIGVARLADRIGMGEKTVRRALSRLQADGQIVQAVRGTGNRHGAQPRESVFVLQPIHVGDGLLLPDEEWLADAWRAYSATPRFDRLSPANRTAVLAARPVDNVLLAVSRPPTSGHPRPHRSQDKSLNADHAQMPQQRHPRVAERLRRRLQVVTTGGET